MELIEAAVVFLIAGGVLCVAAPSKRAQAWSAIVSQAIATVLVLGAVVPMWLGAPEIRALLPWAPPIDHVSVHIDALSAVFLAFSLPMTLGGTIYATGYLSKAIDGPRHVGTHFALLNAVQLSYIIIYGSESSLMYLLGWEIAAFSAWLLVIFEHHSQKIRFAGFNYLISTHVGLLFLVAAVMLLYARTGSLDFGDFTSFYSRPSAERGVVFLLLLTSFGLKSAFFPFHTWLPRAHAAAPAHVSALMSGVIHKAGLFGFLRFTMLMGTPEPWMGWVVLAFGTMSALTGVMYSATQRDMKRLLGYSSTENVGIAMMGFGAGYLGLAYHVPTLAILGFGGGLLHVVNHALFKCLLFYAAGAVNKATHVVDIERLGGLAKPMPRTALAFLVGGLAICGLPPLNGLVSEFLIYSAFFSGRGSTPVDAILGLFAAALAFTGAVSALSTVRAFGVAFLGAPRDATLPPAEEAPRSIQTAYAGHIAGIAAIGLCPLLGVWIAASSVSLLVGPEVGSDAALVLTDSLRTLTWMHCALAVALVGLWLARRALLPGVATTATTWGCGYTAPSPRMQYSAASFSDPLLALFASALPKQTTIEAPNGIFPTRGRIKTNYFDAVERWIFDAIYRIEHWALRAAGRTPDAPGPSFALGALTLVLLVGWVLYSFGEGL